MAIDIILCDIIQNFTGIDASRIVVYNQNFKAPTDQGIFIVVSTGSTQIIAEVEKFDSDTDEMVSTISMYTQLAVEITSQNRDALDRKHEIIMAINSVYSIRQQEDNNISIKRNGNFLDLSAVDGASSLHRFQIPVIISHMETKRTAIEPIDKFQAVEVDTNG